jgi:hypothetical protein
MQIAGTSLQLLGAFVTAIGLFYAWNRASTRFDQWRQSVRSTLNGLRAQVARRNRGAIDAELRVGVDRSAGMTVGRSGTVEERLLRVENEISELPGQTKQTIESAINDKLAEFDATGKGFTVKDIRWALVGLGIAALGNLLNLICYVMSAR